MASRGGIDALLYLLDEAWRALPDGAGEINHIRSPLDGDERLRYVQLGFG